MSNKIKVLTTITVTLIALAVTNPAYSHDRGYHPYEGATIIVRSHDRVYYPPVSEPYGYTYFPAHARQFNDRQYLRMKKHHKKKRKIRRLRRLNNAYYLERPVVIVTRPLY